MDNLDNCGKYADMVTGLVVFATKLNPEEKKKYDAGKSCCYVKVPEDYKNWTKENLKELATTPHGCSIFAYLSVMSRAALARDENSQFTADARCAQQALRALSSKDLVSFITTINEVASENQQGIKDAFFQQHKDYVDACVTLLDKKEGMTKLSRKNLEKLANRKETYGVFDMIIYTARCTEDGDQRVADYSKQVLNKLSPDGNWQTLYKDLAMVEAATFKVRQAAKRMGAIDPEIKTDITIPRAEVAEFDQQAALKLLEARGVKLESTHELQAPPQVQALAAVKDIRKSVSLVA